MSQEYSITFRRLENKTNLHINDIKKVNKDFCSIHPYFVNVNLGKDIRCLLCDGQHIIDVTEWSGFGLSLSNKIDPTEKVKDLINNFVFDANN
jgi:hypothetical protein